MIKKNLIVQLILSIGLWLGLTIYVRGQQMVVFPVGDPNEAPTTSLPNKNGYRINQPYENQRGHTGVDLVNAPVGESPTAGGEVRTIADGEVVLSVPTEDSKGFGNVVLIRHTFSEGTYYSLYAHLQEGSILVEEGASVKIGVPIGRVGSTGNSTGPHLHFAIKRTGILGCGYINTDCNSERDSGFNNYVDPIKFIADHFTIPPIIQEFNFALDTFAVDGNILGSGNADGFFDFFDDFNDGSLTTPPTSLFSFPQGVEATNESVGFLNFTSSDGAAVDDGGNIYDEAKLNHVFADGGGDSVITAVFRADTPKLGQFYSLGISDEFKPKSDVAFVFVQSFEDESNAFVVAQQFTGEKSETLAISEVNLTSVDRIFLLFVILDDTNELIPLYSIDEGMTFIEFSPEPLRVFTASNSAFVFTQGGFLADFRCGDGIDNDGDGLVDSEDPDCDL